MIKSVSYWTNSPEITFTHPWTKASGSASGAKRVSARKATEKKRKEGTERENSA